VKKFLTNFLKLAVSLGLGVGIIWWVLSHMTETEKEQTIDAFKRAKYGWLLLAPVLGLLSNFSRAQRWRLLLEPTGHKPGYWNTFFSVMMMYFFNLFFPRLGEVTRCGVLARYEKVPLDKSIGTMVVERVVDLVSILSIGGLLFLLEHERLLSFWENKDKLSGGGTATVQDSGSNVTLIVFGIVALMLIIGVAYIQRKVGFEKLLQFAKERIKGFAQGLMSIRNLKSPFEFIFHSVFIWLCYIGMVYVSFPALQETQNLSFLAAMAALFCCGFALVLAPGGVGFYPLFMQFVLTMYGVDATIGYAFGSLAWAAQNSATLLGGIISLILLAILNKEPALDK
jgi:uncharacterized membrane protein YbhN (UPF0104 family)